MWIKNIKYINKIIYLNNLFIVLFIYTIYLAE